MRGLIKGLGAILLSAGLSTGLLTACGPMPDCASSGSCAEGKSCRAQAECAQGLICFPTAPNGGLGECRRSCSPTTSCNVGFNCYDPGAGIAMACVPAPASDEPWTLVVESVSVPALNAMGQPWDGASSDVPDPFVCFSGIANTTLCTSEQHGYAASWKTTPFTTAVTTNSLLQTSITVFDSDAIFDFSGCEGTCSALSSWSKDTVYGKAWDLRPKWSHQPQVWVLSETTGFRLEVHLNPVP